MRDPVVVATDLGFAKKGRNYATRPGYVPIAFIEKRRTGNDAKTEALTLIGDVKNAMSSSWTMKWIRAAPSRRRWSVVKKHGARDVYLAFIHPIFSKNCRGKTGRPAHQTHHHHGYGPDPAGK
jgi:ribose-phosphate pyrophosphokinase